MLKRPGEDIILADGGADSAQRSKTEMKPKEAAAKTREAQVRTRTAKRQAPARPVAKPKGSARQRPSWDNSFAPVHSSSVTLVPARASSASKPSTRAEKRPAPASPVAKLEAVARPRRQWDSTTSFVQAVPAAASSAKAAAWIAKAKLDAASRTRANASARASRIARSSMQRQMETTTLAHMHVHCSAPDLDREPIETQPSIDDASRAMWYRHVSAILTQAEARGTGGGVTNRQDSEGRNFMGSFSSPVSWRSPPRTPRHHAPHPPRSARSISGGSSPRSGPRRRAPTSPRPPWTDDYAGVISRTPFFDPQIRSCSLEHDERVARGYVVGVPLTFHHD